MIPTLTDLRFCLDHRDFIFDLRNKTRTSVKIHLIFTSGRGLPMTSCGKVALADATPFDLFGG